MRTWGLFQSGEGSGRWLRKGEEQGECGLVVMLKLDRESGRKVFRSKDLPGEYEKKIKIKELYRLPCSPRRLFRRAQGLLPAVVQKQTFLSSQMPFFPPQTPFAQSARHRRRATEAGGVHGAGEAI